MKQYIWNCWHDDGRFIAVEAKDSREALSEAAEHFNESNTNLIEVDCPDNTEVA